MTHSDSVSNQPIDPSLNASQVKALSFANVPATFVPKQIISAAISVSDSTLKHYRKEYWIEGIHYVYLSPKMIRYNLELVVDWAIHRNCPQVHQKAIDVYLSKVEQARKKKRTK